MLHSAASGSAVAAIRAVICGLYTNSGVAPDAVPAQLSGLGVANPPRGR
jgi:hypothetical protein